MLLDSDIQLNRRSYYQATPLQRFAKAARVGMICRGYCLENGLIMPPLVMTHGQVDDMVALILTCLDLSDRGVKQRGWLAQVLDADA